MNRCTECTHYRAGWCVNAIQAQLGRKPRHELGELASIEQNCPGYREANRDSEKQTTSRMQKASIRA